MICPGSVDKSAAPVDISKFLWIACAFPFQSVAAGKIKCYDLFASRISKCDARISRDRTKYTDEAALAANRIVDLTAERRQ
jgi:hypothetical protein